MINIIEYKNHKYPSFQSQGNAAQFAIPYAKHVCVGTGVDVGCNRIEWSFPGSLPVDPVINEFDALNFPYEDLDYVFSSHCLEHLYDWVDVLDYWTSKLKIGGVLFLYLPDYSQEYWKPWNNRKHLNIFSPTILKDYLEDKNYSNIFISQVDLNNAFMVMAEK
jgi:predicted SAM-dependent methyltransferase